MPIPHAHLSRLDHFDFTGWNGRRSELANLFTIHGDALMADLAFILFFLWLFSVAVSNVIIVVITADIPVLILVAFVTRVIRDVVST